MQAYVRVYERGRVLEGVERKYRWSWGAGWRVNMGGVGQGFGRG